jgi:hypothetical protein
MDPFLDRNLYDEQFMFQSLDATVDPGFQPDLPPIPETNYFDLGWIQESNAQLDAHLADPYAQSDSHLPTEHYAGPTEALQTVNLPPVVMTELSNLLEQAKELRQAVLELQGIVCRRLDSMEKSVTATQRYVNNLVPWSMEVHQNYSKLMEVMSDSEKVKTSHAGNGQLRKQ